ncbi:hypothetical protein BKA67DRAFT_537372 [Truncatella angustata]|uniref:BTB domain-containing protein n=1 Tax=Truncatella angustata TaxID=152316 RepID=A0A9P8UG40_9PEZI|nr:uncharacterized protein BKA67DRAFT_537372 [Truncatella angustata]KAH6651503.1 hypothetical protein BKA67DRAFT_537372 [Truncatella angustata]
MPPSTASVPEPPAKRCKLMERAAMYTGQPVKLRSRETIGAFEMHVLRPKLCEHSEYFVRKLGESIVMTLDVSAETLGSFAVWLYEGKVFVDDMDITTNSEEYNNNNDDDDDTNKNNNANQTSGSLGNEFTRSMAAGEISNETILVKTEVHINMENTIPEYSREPEMINGSAGAPAGDPCLPTAPWYDQLDLPKDTDAHNLALHRIDARILDLYLFSRAYELPGLAVSVIVASQRFTRSHAAYASEYVVSKGWTILGPDDPLCQYWLHQFAFSRKFSSNEVDMLWLKALPSEFLFEILRLRPTLLDVGNGDSSDPVADPNPDHKWCFFHGHGSVEEREECERGRKDDPDMKYKRKQGRKSK